MTSEISSPICTPEVIFIEPFYGGSHKVLIDTLIKNVCNYTLVTLPGIKWHWRARCGALVLFNKIPKITTEKVLFCSSVLNLAELLGLRPDLQALKKIVYFHENQLVYPVQHIKERDVQYSYNQIITCLAADVILFNSQFNKDSFITNIKKIIKLLPDHKPKKLEDEIASKSRVLYFPVSFPKNITCTRMNSILRIAWPHRWEFDKGPDDFFHILLLLKRNNHDFKVSILGESFRCNPEIFTKVQDDLKDEISHFGYMESKEDYLNALSTCHVVVSTAKHEFFGVSMLEGTFCGCLPIAPNGLVYPEIYPKSCLYSDLKQLYNILEKFCTSPALVADELIRLNLDLNKYSEDALLPEYLEVLEINTNTAQKY